MAPRRSRIWPPALACAGLALAMPWLTTARADAVVTTGTDGQARLPYWQIVDRGVSIRLVQRLPDQTRGFFQARGFSDADAERIARSCVFQTVFRNISKPPNPPTVEYDLHNWTVHAAGRQGAMKTREDWRQEWIARRAPKSAQLAFEWALLPTRQTYRPGDYNWGMSVFGLKPGARFDLDVVWRQYGRTHKARLKNMQCAPDIHPGPGAS
ncbi:MAG: hypothetical protein ACYDBW_01605 [Sulfuricaulis sp.]